MPYAHKYANMVTEHGIVETLRQFGTGGVVETVFKGARTALPKDADEMMRMLVDAEMKRFAGVKTPVVFLQNVVTDLMLGMNLFDMFKSFHDHIKSRYNAEAGFITMNMPALLDGLESVGIENPIICCNYNKIGFRMSGASRPTIRPSRLVVCAASRCQRWHPAPSQPKKRSAGSVSAHRSNRSCSVRRAGRTSRRPSH